jgi:SAM-dependent methyltransferase
MSVFTSVDSLADPSVVVAYLDQTTQAAWRMKHYATATHELAQPDGPVLDLGCGVGPDLRLLADAGIAAIGLDPSAVLLSEARRRLDDSARLVRAVGEALPFGDGALAGGRIERVLIHVADPGVVLGEVARCLRPGALLTVFEPDWASFHVQTERGNVVTSWLAYVRQPGVGGALWRLVEQAGLEVLDRVEELSVWRQLDVLDRVIGVELALQRAVAADRISAEDARAWLDEQKARDDRGLFYATMPKVMVVARKT